MRQSGLRGRADHGGEGMATQLAFGTLLVAITVLVHTFGLAGLGRWTPQMARSLRFHKHDLGRSVTMVATVLGIFLLHTIEVWIWAAIFAATHAVRGFANALYLSTVMFSTAGFGQMDIAPDWRLLTALESINGFILIGWSTAYLVGASTRHGPFRRDEHF